MITNEQIETLIASASHKLSNKYIYDFEKKSHQIWSRGKELNNSILNLNCLPAHIAILPEVKGLYPACNPGVVIGKITFVNDSFPEDFSVQIKNSKIFNLDHFGDFHAWIQLDIEDENSDFIDITTPATQENPFNSYNLNTNKKNNLKHVAILTTTDDVMEFHAKFIFTILRKERVGIRQSICYLIKLAEYLDLPSEVTLGNYGENLLLELNTNPLAKPSKMQYFKRLFSK